MFPLVKAETQGPGRSKCARECLASGIAAQPGITGFHAHAHENLNRVPEHDCTTFSVLHGTTFKPMNFNLKIVFFFRRGRGLCSAPST